MMLLSIKSNTRPSWCVPFGVAAQPKRNLRNSELILVLSPGFSCWLERVLDQKIMVESPAPRILLQHPPHTHTQDCSTSNFVKMPLSLLYMTLLDRRSGHVVRMTEGKMQVQTQMGCATSVAAEEEQTQHLGPWRTHAFGNGFSLIQSDFEGANHGTSLLSSFPSL